MLGALRGTARRAGRRAVRPAPPAAAAPPAGDDFDAARRRLGAELAYTPRFQSTAPAGEPERGLVAGAAIAWADDLQGMRLKRRAILRWDEGRPRRVLLVKKPADAAATAKLRDLGAWLTSHGVSVVVERAVAATDAPEFEAFDPGAPGGFEGEQSGGDGAESSSSSSSSSSASNASPPVDLAVSLGGDGTVLHLASLFAADAPLPPTLSFALGTLGFLTPFPAATARAVLSRLLWPPWPGEPVYCTLRSRRQCGEKGEGRWFRIGACLGSFIQGYSGFGSLGVPS
jgi:NAD+ kinase